MATIQIKTLTPLHIGSGRQLGIDTEALFYPKENLTALIDPQKVLNILGEDRLHEWTNDILQGKSLHERLPKDTRPADVASELLPGRIDVRTDQPLREHIRSSGLPVLPGSSLKGAIRTAVFGQLIRNDPGAARAYQNVNGNANGLEKRFLGKNPNADIFRLLQVGDAHFVESENYICKVLSQTEGGHDWNPKKYAINLEVISAEQEAYLRLRNADELLNFITTHGLESRVFDGANSKARQGVQLHQLFHHIHDNSRQLLALEQKKIKDNEPNSIYHDRIKQLKEEAENMNPDQECLLRVGFGQGWHFITGGWQKEVLSKEKASGGESLYDNMLATQLKREPHHMQYDMPKSRRLLFHNEEQNNGKKQKEADLSMLAGFNIGEADEGGSSEASLPTEPLGFVKLKLAEEKQPPSLVSLRNKRSKWQAELMQQSASQSSGSAAKGPASSDQPSHSAEQPAASTEPPMLKGNPKQGGEVIGEALANQKPHVQFRLLIEGEEQKVWLRFPAGRTVGKYYRLRIKNVIKKTKVDSVEYLEEWRPE